MRPPTPPKSPSKRKSCDAASEPPPETYGFFSTSPKIGRMNFPKTRWWLNQPIWKICSSNWKSSPGKGENKKYLKPPPRYPRVMLWDDVSDFKKYLGLYVKVLESCTSAKISTPSKTFKNRTCDPKNFANTNSSWVNSKKKNSLQSNLFLEIKWIPIVVEPF